MGLFVKICGLARAADVLAVAALQPQALGFVFWAGSKRAVRAGEVRAWIRDVPAALLKVGVFVDASPDEVRRTMETAGLDVAQLHGAERPEDFVGCPFRLWRALNPRTAVEPVPVGWSVDAFLIDTYSAQSPGGTGQVGDWTVARAFVQRCARPVLLAGGLRPENVKDAVAAVQPWGVDVSSGVEMEPGRKDLAKVREFMERCREE
jgi:phosphoribosylanthranilate isomerase